MSPARYEATVLHRPETAELRYLPECPYPCGDAAISWVAIQHGEQAKVGSINRLDLKNNQNVTFLLEGRPGFAFPTDRAETFVVGMERSVALVDLDTGDSRPIVQGIDAGVEGTIINDAVICQAGLIFGCKDLRFQEKKAGLYLLRQRDGALIRLRNDQVCSNGKVVIGCGEEEVRLLDIDSPTKTVVEYQLDVEAGSLSEPRVVVDLRDGAAVPDGMVLAPDGESVIVAMYNPGDVPHGEARRHRIADGQLLDVWITPGSPRVTCPQLVDLAGRTLLILTTAVEQMSPDQQTRHPNAGALFYADVDFAGATPQPRFAG